jgi:5-methyltetrahydrofolate--homocysteine methyltransferase
MELLALSREGALLGDGGLGTALIASGLPLGQPGEVWNLDRPEAVGAVHAAFLRAGSQVIQTNTFGGNRPRLEAHGVADRFEVIQRRGVELAREQAQLAGARWVVGSMGPTGLPAATDPALVEAVFAEQARCLVAGGVDMLWVETMTSLAEARCALRGSLPAGAPVAVSLVVSDELRTLGDDRPLANAARTLADAGASALGVNCVGSAVALAALPKLLEAGRPVILAPNAGQPELLEQALRYPQAAEAFARAQAAAAVAGAAVVGGCCGVEPAFISALAARLARA